jgi:hypothetical protein
VFGNHVACRQGDNCWSWTSLDITGRQRQLSPFPDQRLMIGAFDQRFAIGTNFRLSGPV